MEQKVKVAILGAGTAGLYALGQVKKQTDDFVLIDGGPLGTTCARVGCMPSKHFISLARRHGQPDGASAVKEKENTIPEILAQVRKVRDGFVNGLLEGMFRDLGDRFVNGYGRFVDEGLLDVDGKRIRAERVVIATGSSPVVPEGWKKFGKRIVTTDELYEMEDLPESIGVIGMGSIGLEMAVTFRRLGLEVIGVDQVETVADMRDPAVASEAVDVMRRRFDIWLGSEAQLEEGKDGKISVRAGDNTAEVKGALVSIGRRPNLDSLGLDQLGINLSDRGIPEFNPSTMQIGNLPVFIAGDVTGSRGVLHEAADEGMIAGYNAVRSNTVSFRRKTPLRIVFTQPDIAAVGAEWNTLNPERIAVGEYRLSGFGRAVLMGREEGIVRIYAYPGDGRILGAALLAPRGEHLAHLLSWAVMENMNVDQLLTMPYYHPCMEETLFRALRKLRASLDLDPQPLPGLQQL